MAAAIAAVAAAAVSAGNVRVIRILKGGGGSIRRCLFVFAIFVLAGVAGLETACDNPKPVAKLEVPAAAVRNDTLLLLSTNQQSVKVVRDHVLDDATLPGGTVGRYSNKGKSYQLFVIRTDSNADAAQLLLKLKKTLPDAEFIAHFGGYAGTHKAGALLTFTKLQFLLGVVGLPKEEADPIARQFALKIQ